MPLHYYCYTKAANHTLSEKVFFICLTMLPSKFDRKDDSSKNNILHYINIIHIYNLYKKHKCNNKTKKSVVEH